MRSLLTGRMRVFEQSPDGLLFDAQPPGSIGVKAAELGQDGQPVVEPGAFFVDGSYGIRINSWNSLAGVVITVRARFLNSDGRLINQEWTHTPNSNRTKATSDFPLGVGFPLNVTAFASTGTPLIGQTFVQVQIISGLGGATTLLGTMLQDYVTSVQALAWPGSPIRSSIEGGGFPRTIVGAAPAAGAQVIETVPTGARWVLRSWFQQFATAVAVANRFLFLQVFSGANQKMMSPSPVAQAASLTWFYTWAPGLVSQVGGDPRFIAMAYATQFPILAAETLQVSVTNLQAADQLSAPIYTVEEFLEVSS